ncbi:MAG: hypothetical protein QOG52_2736 [Frankiaceae bacterium]|jgi:N-acetylneuraminic acid mutarotase|nr:hypothetical protein [Frankiaceae bacterium]
MADDERIRTLLRAAALGEPSSAPVDRLVASGRRSVRRRRIAIAALTACAIAGVVVVPTVLLSHDPRPNSASGPKTPHPVMPLATVPAYPTTGPGTAEALAHAKWTALPPAPIEWREVPASVYTGRELLVWGGLTETGPVGDGASYDPTARKWQLLPTAPIGARTGSATAWTGSQWFVWGGRNGSDALADGALYDAASGTWSSLPPGPLSGRGEATAVWTGSEVLVFGGSGDIGGANPTDAAAYDPATRAWRLLGRNPAMPAYDMHQVTAVAVGPTIYVADMWGRTVRSTDGKTVTGTTAGVVLSAYDVASDTWAPAPGPPLAGHGVNQLIWTGREVIAPASPGWCDACSGLAPMNEQGHRFALPAAAWDELPHGPIDDFWPTDVWTGAALVAPPTGGMSGETVMPGDAAAWDPVRNSWVRLPRAPVGAMNAVAAWTGTQLLVWGGYRNNGGASLG